MAKVIYEKHPVSPERKAELRGQGYTIIDAQFKPADVEQEEAEQEAPKDNPRRKAREE